MDTRTPVNHGYDVTESTFGLYKMLNHCDLN